MSDQIGIEQAAKRLGVIVASVQAWIEDGVLAGFSDGKTITASAEDVERLHAEFYGVPDLVFDQPEGAVPGQAPRLSDQRRCQLASCFVVCVRTTLTDTVYPEITIERRSFVPGEDRWAICWAGMTFSRGSEWGHKPRGGPGSAHRFTLDEAFERAGAAIEAMRGKVHGGHDGSYISLLTPPS